MGIEVSPPPEQRTPSTHLPCPQQRPKAAVPKSEPPLLCGADFRVTPTCRRMLSPHCRHRRNNSNRGLMEIQMNPPYAASVEPPVVERQTVTPTGDQAGQKVRSKPLTPSRTSAVGDHRFAELGARARQRCCLAQTRARRWNLSECVPGPNTNKTQPPGQGPHTWVGRRAKGGPHIST